MIEKLKQNEDKIFRTESGETMVVPALNVPQCISDKINHLVDAVNELQDQVKEIKQYLDWDEISGAENCESAKNAHKSDLEEALEGFPGLFKSNKDEPLVDAVMQEAKENHKIRSTNERLRKALDCAIDTLDTVYGLSEDNSNIETYIKCKRIEINGIIKGGKDE